MEFRKRNPAHRVEEDEYSLLPKSGPTSSGTSRVDVEMKQILKDSFFSIGILYMLLEYKVSLTPSFFQFVLCLTTDQAELVWALVSWFFYKSLLVRNEHLVILNEKARIVTISF